MSEASWRELQRELVLQGYNTPYPPNMLPPSGYSPLSEADVQRIAIAVVLALRASGAPPADAVRYVRAEPLGEVGEGAVSDADDPRVEAMAREWCRSFKPGSPDPDEIVGRGRFRGPRWRGYATNMERLLRAIDNAATRVCERPITRDNGSYHV